MTSLSDSWTCSCSSGWAAARPAVESKTPTANPVVDTSVRDNLIARLLSAKVEPVESAPPGTAGPRELAHRSSATERRAALRTSPQETGRRTCEPACWRPRIGGHLRPAPGSRPARGHSQPWIAVLSAHQLVDVFAEAAVRGCPTVRPPAHN